MTSASLHVPEVSQKPLSPEALMSAVALAWLDVFGCEPARTDLRTHHNTVIKAKTGHKHFEPKR